MSTSTACGACGAVIADVDTIMKTARVSWAGPDGSAAFQDTPNVAIGNRAFTEPGFVNAKRPHTSGLPWYIPGKDADSPRRHMRTPSVVTCRCGSDTIIDLGNKVRSFLSTAAPSDLTTRAAGDSENPTGLYYMKLTNEVTREK